MRHKVIYSLHPEVKRIKNDSDCFDANGNAVAIDEALVQAELDRLIAEQPAKEARTQRDALLSQSDWTQVPDAPVDQAAWAEYRQALRDLPQQEGFPQEVVWPNPPA